MNAETAYALELYDKGEKEEAVARLKKLAKKYKNDFDVHRILGAFCGRSEDYERAVESLTHALSLPDAPRSA